LRNLWFRFLIHTLQLASPGEPVGAQLEFDLRAGIPAEIALKIMIAGCLTAWGDMGESWIRAFLLLYS
jgi:hypothetical protein